MNNSMWINVALAERCLRAVLGLTVIFYLLAAPIFPALFASSYLVSLYLLLTALIAWDPLYASFYKATELTKITINETVRGLYSGHQTVT